MPNARNPRRDINSSLRASGIEMYHLTPFLWRDIQRRVHHLFAWTEYSNDMIWLEVHARRGDSGQELRMGNSVVITE
jgi:hypothetical protein